MKKGNPWALIPIGVFVVVYLTLGIVFEYVMQIPMGFYSVPVVVAFLVALLVACLQNKKVNFDKKLEIMGQGVGDKNIITMLLIFMLAGIFVGVVGRSSAESVAYFMLSITPPEVAVCVLFIVSCFVSTAMGTSVGTITLITPIAVAVADASGFSMALCVGTVVGGCQHLTVYHLADKEGGAAQIVGLGHGQGQEGACPLGEIVKTVLASCHVGESGEFIGVSARLHSKVLEQREGRIGGDGGQIALAGCSNHIVGVGALDNRNRHTGRIVGHLHCRVDDGGVIAAVFLCGQQIYTVGEII